MANRQPEMAAERLLLELALSESHFSVEVAVDWLESDEHTGPSRTQTAPVSRERPDPGSLSVWISALMEGGAACGLRLRPISPPIVPALHPVVTGAPLIGRPLGG